jgi:hypothetical protein
MCADHEDDMERSLANRSITQGYVADFNLHSRRPKPSAYVTETFIRFKFELAKTPLHEDKLSGPSKCAFCGDPSLGNQGTAGVCKAGVLHFTV